jgi:hypothetical protein
VLAQCQQAIGAANNPLRVLASVEVLDTFSHASRVTLPRAKRAWCSSVPNAAKYIARSPSAVILRLHKQRSYTRREEKWASCNPTSEAQSTKNAVALSPALAILIPSMAAAKNEGPAAQTILGAVQSSADAGDRLNLRHRPGAQAAVTASSGLSSFVCTKAWGSIALRTLLQRLKKGKPGLPVAPGGPADGRPGKPGPPPTPQELPGT